MTEFFGEARLNEIAQELEDSRTQKRRLFAELGEKALPELIDKPAFSELLAEINAVSKQTEALKEEEIALSEARLRHEREQKESLARRTCPKCSTISDEDARFCEECGSKVGELPREFCKSCCTMNYIGMKFCGECGSRLGDVEMW